MKKVNPDCIIEALEKVCERFKVHMSCTSTRQAIIVHDEYGMTVCSFKKLTERDGPIDLQIGGSYEDSYSTDMRVDDDGRESRDEEKA